MNTYEPAHTLCKAKATHLCFLVLLCFHLALGDVPGPCKHSVTRDHLKKVNSLIANQLQNGCSITYTFTEQQHLSNTCYVKAAFPKILELLTTHFKYGQSSENFNYVQDMKALVKHIYIQRCIPEINLQLEEDPAKFVQTYTSSPREALERVRKVLSLYMDLMTNSNGPVNWNCEEQYSVEVPESTTILSQSTGTAVCQCSCPTAGYGAPEQASLAATSLWKGLPKPTDSQTPIAQPSWLSKPPFSIPHTEASPLAIPGSIVPDRQQKNRHTKFRASTGNEGMPWDYTSLTEFTPPLVKSSSLSPGYNMDSSIKEGDGTQKSRAPYLVVHSESPPIIPIVSAASLDSIQPTSTADSIVAEDHSSSETPLESYLFTEGRSPGLDEISSLTTDKTTEHIHPKKDNMIISSPFPDGSVDHPTTSAPHQDNLFEITPSDSDESTEVAILAKRSVDPRMEELYYHPDSHMKLHQTRVSASVSSASEEDLERFLDGLGSISPVPQSDEQEMSSHTGSPRNTNSKKTQRKIMLGEVVSSWQKTEDASAPAKTQQIMESLSTISPSLVQQSQPMYSGIRDETNVNQADRLGSQEPHMNSILTTEEPAGHSGKGAQNGASEVTNATYKISFITVAVCGGLLLTIALYCYWQKKKPEVQLHRSEMERLDEDQRDIEITAC
ncbi:macrophage colony-stimulating factor 1a isoform X2 [Amia ocellicauda]|uniref:macrophage colony-stimulating factor 1a isoform X2 n=1 Tax=Amia ocellicauda TaxID=2972642 RepID=UPI003464452B